MSLLIKNPTITPSVNLPSSPIVSASSPRNQALRDFLSVKDFGAVGDNNADDTTPLANAIAAALSANTVLYFPGGTYKITSSIANFHTVRKQGTGIINRLGNLFYIEPAYNQVNILHVSTSGNDSQTGFSSASSDAVKTVQGAFNIIQNYGPILRGTWSISLAAGTYTEGAAWSLGSSAAYPGMRAALNITGPELGGAEPTAIIDGTSAVKLNGIFLQGPFDLRMTAVEVRNFDNEGVLLQDRAVGTFVDAWVVNNGDGFVGNIHATVALKGACVASGHTNTGAGFGHGVLVKDHSTFSSDSNANGTPMVKDNTYGVDLAENAIGHAWALNVQDNVGAGIVVALNSRLALEATVNIKRHISGQGGAFLYANGVLEDVGAVWNDNTADRNYPRVTYWDFSVYRFPTGAANYKAFAERIKLINTATITHTGTLTETTLLDSSTATIPFKVHPNDLTYLSRKLRIKIAGTLTGTAGTKTLKVKLGGTTFATQAFVSANSGAFVLDIDFLHTGATDSGTQLVVQKSVVAVGTQPAPAVGTTSISQNVAADMAVTITGQLGDAGDTIAINQIEMAEV